MATKAQKKELARVRKQFRQDLARLKEEYENLELAQKTGIDPANLSSYGSGSKEPGMTVLKQFYSALADETDNPLEKLISMENAKTTKGGEKDPKGQRKTKGQKGSAKYNHDTPPSGHLDRSDLDLGRKDEAEGLRKELYTREKFHNANLQANMEKMLDTGKALFQIPNRLLDSFDKLVLTHDKATEKELVNARTHEAMTDAFLRTFGGDQTKLSKQE